MENISKETLESYKLSTSKHITYMRGELGWGIKETRRGLLTHDKELNDIGAIRKLLDRLSDAPALVVIIEGK